MMVMCFLFLFLFFYFNSVMLIQNSRRDLARQKTSLFRNQLLSNATARSDRERFKRVTEMDSAVNEEEPQCEFKTACAAVRFHGVKKKKKEEENAPSYPQGASARLVRSVCG